MKRTIKDSVAPASITLTEARQAARKYRMGQNAGTESDRKLRDAEIVELREQGLSYRQIAKKIGGISSARAMQIVAKANKTP